VGSDAGFFAEACAGFRHETRPDLVFSGRALADDPDAASLLLDRDAWTVTLGDTDLV
jgi:hypothetical protein